MSILLSCLVSSFQARPIGKEGQKCRVEVKGPINAMSMQGQQPEEVLGKRILYPKLDPHNIEGDDETDSDEDIEDIVLTSEELKKYEEITLYFGKGKKPLTIPASTLCKVVMKAREDKRVNI